MIKIRLYLKTIKIQFLLFFSLVIPATGQIIPDQSLRQESSTVTVIDEFNERIEGGAIRGKNLFHSFQEFNIAEEISTYFVNPNGINNIFSRVTGNNVSHILGKLGVLGNANLFLMNPNGFIFGRDASLDINGSFLGTTASSILFDNEVEFSTENNQEALSLVISQPIGLKFSNAGTIIVRGYGHVLLDIPPFTSAPIQAILEDRPRLSVKSGKSLNFLGGNILFEGGNAVAELSRIELSAIKQGLVNFNIDKNNLKG